METKKLLGTLERWEAGMVDDYNNNREGKYPPLYSKDYLFGKLKATRELINYIERSK